ncbi:MAG: outer membrane lipoprotein LolB [Burkholderiaceae bacterium]|jgi:outer membrane lipoprotein LolB|nr:outer membrane lipoprotein LolB [Burkholderiaceae bacterium]
MRTADRGRRGLLALLAAGLCAGCSTIAPVEPAPRVRSGRFSASIAFGERRESVAGRFTLAASPSGTTLELASPLGNTLARVAASADGATLTAARADGTLATWHGDSADALAESVLGYRLPVAGLADWIDGRPTPGSVARVQPAHGPAQRIEQDGWVVVVDERFPATEAPRRLSLERDEAGPHAPTVRLRLVLDDAGATLEAPDRSRP